jgi:spectinomycin phosphotransferase
LCVDDCNCTNVGAPIVSVPAVAPTAAACTTSAHPVTPRTAIARIAEMRLRLASPFPFGPTRPEATSRSRAPTGRVNTPIGRRNPAIARERRERAVASIQRGNEDGASYGGRVYTEPPDLDRATLAGVLERHWGFGVPRLDYLPLGFGSHHWSATATDGPRWFVSADDLDAGHHGGRARDDVFGVLDRAFRVAAALRDLAQLEFVLAPLPSEDGTVLRRIDPRYAVRVDPFVDGRAGEFGEFDREDERRRMGTLLGRLHAATDRVPLEVARREDFVLPGRKALEEALADLDTPWAFGPFAERTRDLLRSRAPEVRARLDGYDALAQRIREQAGSWVVTHGEPHSANVMRDARGGLHLVDWDTALIGPPERDLWMVLDRDRIGWDEYREQAGAVRLDEEALGLYRERWGLAEICVYVAEFRRPHEETADTRASWENLGDYLPRR